MSNSAVPKQVEKTLTKIEKQDTKLVTSVEKEIKSLQKKLGKFIKGTQKSDKKADKAAKYESKTAKKASAATVAHEKAVIALRNATETAQKSKQDRDNTSAMLDSKRRELDTLSHTKKVHDEQAQLKRAELTHAAEAPATEAETVKA